MTTQRPKLRYIFENPNAPEVVELVLRKIVLEKLLSYGKSNST